MADFNGCQLTAGISLDCRDSNGGIEKIFVANANGEVTYTLTSGSDCEIDSISVDGVALTPSDFFTYELTKQTSSFTETATISSENATIFYEQAVTMIFTKMQCAVRDQLLLLGQNTELLVIVKDNNGIYWTVGLERGAELTAGTTSTGVAYGDRSGYELVVTGREKLPTFTVDSTVVIA